MHTQAMKYFLVLTPFHSQSQSYTITFFLLVFSQSSHPRSTCLNLPIFCYKYDIDLLFSIFLFPVVDLLLGLSFETPSVGALLLHAPLDTSCIIH